MKSVFCALSRESSPEKTFFNAQTNLHCTAVKVKLSEVDISIPGQTKSACPDTTKR